MDTKPHLYEDFTVHATTLWAQSVVNASAATEAPQFHEALANLVFLHRVFIAWPVRPCEYRHQHAMLILIEDTVIWLEAQRDGGDVHTTTCDLNEAYEIVRYEADRLFRPDHEAFCT